LLKRRNVIVTGASRGIGLEISKALMECGWRVGLCVRDASVSGLDDVSQLVADSDSKIFEAELTDSESLTKLVEEIKHWSKGTLHGLVNNAGIAHGGLIQTTRLDDVRRIFEVNFFAVLNLTQRLHRYLRRADGAAIVNLSSIASVQLTAGQVAYGVSKASINALTKVMAQEYRKNNILVNAILPAATNAGMSAEMDLPALELQISNMAHKELIPFRDIVFQTKILLDREITGLTGQLIKIDNGIP
jgi:3-oxoacyl-[acyl-carrier protein] reductase